MITIQQEALAAALSAVTRASLKSTLMAAFALVRLDASPEGNLCLSCFNGETAARAIASCACTEGLSVHVDAQTLKAVTETLSGEVHLVVEGNALHLENGSNRTHLNLIDETIPIIGAESLQSLASLPGHLLRSLGRAIPFASTDEVRLPLNVLHLAFSKAEATARAADGYTAARVVEQVNGPQEEQSLALPVSFARLLVGLVEDEDTVQVQTSGPNHFLFEITNDGKAKHLTLATVTAAGNFPAEQVEQLITDARKSTQAHLSIRKHSLAQIVRMVTAMNTQSTFLKACGGVVKVASAETEVGQVRSLLEGTASGQDAWVWLSAVFLKRAAEACKAEIAIHIMDEKKPVLFEEGSFMALLMPLSIENSKDPFADEEAAIPLDLPEMVVPA